MNYLFRVSCDGATVRTEEKELPDEAAARVEAAAMAARAAEELPQGRDLFVESRTAAGAVCATVRIWSRADASLTAEDELLSEGEGHPS